MARLNHEKLNALRSGQTVWRVWGHANGSGEVHVDADRYIVLGKKVLHWFSRGEEYSHSSLRMVCARPEPMPWQEGWDHREQRAHFLTDLQGLGCFTSYRAAQRFAKDINEGRYPEITQSLIEQYEDDKAFDDWYDEVEREDYLNDPINEGDLGLDPEG